VYIKVPLTKHDHQTVIKDIRIDEGQEWKNKIISQLGTYKKCSLLQTVRQLVSDAIQEDHTSIASLNKTVVEQFVATWALKPKLRFFRKWI